MMHASLPSFTEEDEFVFQISMFQIKNGRYCIDHESTYTDTLITIEKSLIKLAKDNNEIEGINIKKYQNLLSYENLKSNVYFYFPLSKFSPYVSFYFEFCSKYMINLHTMKDSEIMEILIKLKKELNSNNFIKKVLQRKKDVSNNKRSIIKYVDDLFKYYAKILVVRIDLKYNIYSQYSVIIEDVEFFFGKTVFYKDEEQLKTCGIETQKHKDQLIRTVKKQYGNDLIGYIWNMRYGEEKGFYYPMIFFLDGNKYQNGSCIAESIGNLWVNEITQKKGLYVNLNLEKKLLKKNKYVMIEIIKYTDNQLRKKLNRMVTSLVKNEYFLRTVINNKSHSYDRGQSPKKKKVGRPRKQDVKTAMLAESDYYLLKVNP